MGSQEHTGCLGCMLCLGRQRPPTEATPNPLHNGAPDSFPKASTSAKEDNAMNEGRGAYADSAAFVDPTGTFCHAPPPLRPVHRTHKVRVIYLVPRDRQATNAWREKITTVMTFVADVYREDFKRKGIPGGNLDFEFASDGQLDVHLLRGTLPSSAFIDPAGTDCRQWPNVEAEVNRRFGRPEAAKRIYVTFAETYGLGPSPFEYPSGVARGCKFSADGGMGIFSAWILRDEFCASTVLDQLRLFNDDTPIIGRTALGHGHHNSPRHQFIQDGIGAVVHEVGHALGLLHDMRKDDEYIMGNGFRCIRHNYIARFLDRSRVGFSDDNIRMLQYSRFLAAPQPAPTLLSLPRLLLAETKPSVTLHLPHDLTIGTQFFTVLLEARSNQELGAVVLHHQQKGSVTGGASLEGKAVSCEVSVLTEPLAAGTFSLLAVVTDRSGNDANHEATCQVW